MPVQAVAPSSSSSFFTVDQLPMAKERLASACPRDRSRIAADHQLPLALKAFQEDPYFMFFADGKIKYPLESFGSAHNVDPGTMAVLKRLLPSDVTMSAAVTTLLREFVDNARHAQEAHSPKIPGPIAGGAGDSDAFACIDLYFAQKRLAEKKLAEEKLPNGGSWDLGSKQIFQDQFQSFCKDLEKVASSKNLSLQINPSWVLEQGTVLMARLFNDAVDLAGYSWVTEKLDAMVTALSRREGGYATQGVRALKNIQAQLAEKAKSAIDLLEAQFQKIENNLTARARDGSSKLGRLFPDGKQRREAQRKSDALAFNSFKADLRANARSFGLPTIGQLKVPDLYGMLGDLTIPPALLADVREVNIASVEDFPKTLGRVMPSPVRVTIDDGRFGPKQLSMLGRQINGPSVKALNIQRTALGKQIESLYPAYPSNDRDTQRQTEQEIRKLLSEIIRWLPSLETLNVSANPKLNEKVKGDLTALRSRIA